MCLKLAGLYVEQQEMLLELSVLSYHRLSPKQVAIKRFDQKGGSLGRSENADWCLPDPERVVSGIHATIECKNSGFYITDKSTNGLYINRAVDALGSDRQYELKHGDVLCLGDYELQVALLSDAETYAAQRNVSAGSSTTPSKHQAKTLSAVAITSAQQGAVNVSTASPQVGLKAQPQVLLDDNFSLPSALIPDDWANDWVSDEAALHPVSSVPLPVTRDNKQSAVAGQQTYLDAFLKGMGISADMLPNTESAQFWEQLGEALQCSLSGLIDVMQARSSLKNSLRVNQTTFQQRENNPLKFSATAAEAFNNMFCRTASSFMPPRQAIKEAFSDIKRHEAAMHAGSVAALDATLAQLAPHAIEAKSYQSSFIELMVPGVKPLHYWKQYKTLYNELSVQQSNAALRGKNDDFIVAYENYLRTN